MGTYTKLLELDKEKTEPKTSSKPPIAKSPGKKRIVKKQQSNNKTRNKDINKEKNQEIKISRFLDFASPALDEKPAHMQSFNYPSFVVDLLDDLIHELKTKERKQPKKPKWRATKTTIFIVSLLYIIWEYREFKEDSVLHKAIFEDR